MTVYLVSLIRVSRRCSNSGLSYLTMTLNSWSSRPWKYTQLGTSEKYELSHRKQRLWQALEIYNQLGTSGRGT